MLEITDQNGNKFDLPIDYEIDMTFKNPMFNDEGSFSLPFDMPLTENNIRLFEYRNRLSSAENADIKVDVLLKISNTSSVRGNLVVDEIDFENKTISVNIESGLGGFLSLAGDTNITDLPCGEKVANTWVAGAEMFDAISLYVEKYPAKNLVFFPFIAANYERSDEFTIENHIINPWNADTEKFYYDANIHYEPIYAPSYFLNYVIKCIFSHFNYFIESNCLADDPDYSQAVILNLNDDHRKDPEDPLTYDFWVSFAKDLPKISIKEFITAIENKFGVKFFINDKAKTVNIKFLEDVLLASYSLGFESIYITKQDFDNKTGVKLASTNDNDSFNETYVKNIKTSRVLGEVEMKQDISSFTDTFPGDLVLVLTENKYYRLEPVSSCEYPDYDANTVYDIYSRVTYNGNKYVSLLNYNKNKQPDTETLFWEQLGLGNYWFFYSYNFQDYSINGSGNTFESVANTCAMDDAKSTYCRELPRTGIERNYYDWFDQKYNGSKEVEMPLKILLYRGLNETKHNPDVFDVATISDMDNINTPPDYMKVFVVETNQVYMYLGGQWGYSNEQRRYLLVPLASSGIYKIKEEFMGLDSVITESYGIIDLSGYIKAKRSLTYNTPTGLANNFKALAYWYSNIRKIAYANIEFTANDIAGLDFSEKYYFDQVAYLLGEVKLKIRPQGIESVDSILYKV